MAKITPFLRRIKTYIRTHKKQTIIGGAVFLVVVGYVAAFFVPRSVEYSYGGDTCKGKLTLLPGVHRAAGNSPYEVRYEGGVSIGNVALAATSVCFTPVQAPEEGVVTVPSAPWGGFFARTHFALHVPAAPVADVEPLAKPLPATKPIELTLNQPDETFEYGLTIGEEAIDCASENVTLVCDITELKLAQGTSYDATLAREFEAQDRTVIHSGALETLDPLKIQEASVKNDQMIYGRPKSFAIKVDKPLEEVEVALTREQEDKEPTKIPLQTKLDGQTLVMSLEEDLPRNSVYKLTLTQLTATDGSTLAEPHTITFRTSDGPKLARTSVGSTRAPFAGAITLTFDQELFAEQDITKLVSVAGVNATVARSGSSIIVRYSGAGRCAPITITIKEGLLSKHEVRQGKPATFRTRTVCHTIETAGISAQGRPITAYVFGNGATTYLYTGAIHGNELSSRYTMENFIADLEANPGRIPANARVVIVPVANPDGALIGARNNARGVNLNRNFPTRNWTADTEVSGGRVEKGAGGPSAGSEPETKALMNLTHRYAPRLVVTHHSQGSLVNSNDVGVALPAGQAYARMARYWFIPNSQTTATFGFVMTGTYESWLLERGTPAILIELNTHTGNHYARNSAAMWAMLKY